MDQANQAHQPDAYPPRGAYPKDNLFVSRPWMERLNQFGMALASPNLSKHQGITWAALGGSHLSDFEPSLDDLETHGIEWDQLKKDLSEKRVDILVLRKLVEQGLPAKKDRSTQFASVHPYSISPYLDLRMPIAPKKDSIQDILRTQKKITREFGNLELHFAHDQNDRINWYHSWSTFKLASGHFSEKSVLPFLTWTTEGTLPEWMKLVTLKLHPHEENSSPIILAAGLFYQFAGVFYCYSPAMNSDPQWRRFGPGKIMTQKLIEYAKEQGCHTFDFLQGDHGYKYHWNPKQRQLYQCLVPLTLKGRAYLGLKATTKRWTQYCADRFQKLRGTKSENN